MRWHVWETNKRGLSACTLCYTIKRQENQILSLEINRCLKAYIHALQLYSAAQWISMPPTYPDQSAIYKAQWLVDFKCTKPSGSHDLYLLVTLPTFNTLSSEQQCFSWEILPTCFILQAFNMHGCASVSLCVCLHQCFEWCVFVFVD